ncbi:mitogen-activated protein kinase 6, partial [Reticulomyxa filosa]
IIDLIDVVVPDQSEIETFNEVYLIMPKMETTLAKVIQSKQNLTDRHLQFFLYQILRGLKLITQHTLLFLLVDNLFVLSKKEDKPENILVNGADCEVRITDFGLARGVSKEDEVGKPTEYVVTRWYRSPEVMCSAGMYDEAVDIWSVGCIMAELILRKPLFPGQNCFVIVFYLDQLKIIFDTMGTPKDLEWIKTPEAKRWVQKLKPHDGKDLQKVFEKASDKARDLLLKMLTLDPKYRITAVQSLEHPWLSDLHREQDEVTCPKFDLSFEFEKSITTKFGVRHMMYEALTNYKQQEMTKQKSRYIKKKKSHNQDEAGSKKPEKVEEKENEDEDEEEEEEQPDKTQNDTTQE